MNRKKLLTDGPSRTTCYRSKTCHGVYTEIPFCGVGKYSEVISHGWLPSRERFRRSILVFAGFIARTYGLVFFVCNGGGRASHLEVIVTIETWVGVQIVNAESRCRTGSEVCGL